MGTKDTPRQESQVKTLKVMTQSHDQRIFSFKDTPQFSRKKGGINLVTICTGCLKETVSRELKAFVGGCESLKFCSASQSETDKNYA